MSKKTTTLVFVLISISVVASVIWLAAWPSTRKPTGPLQRVTLQLKWLHQAQFAGFYAADQKGFYRDEGLDVAILPIGDDLSEQTVINRVASGEIQFGVAGADRIVLARSENIPIKATSVIYQKSPVVFAALSSTGIKSMKDLVGKKMGIEKGQNTETMYRAMMKTAGVDMKKVTEVSTPPGLGSMIEKKIDARMIYLTNEGVDAKERGVDLSIIYPEDLGISVYADTLFTSDALIKSNPELVRKFVRASIKGWEWATVYPKEASLLPEFYNPKLNPAHELNMMEYSLPFIFTNKSAIGGMTAENWQSTENLLLQSGLLKTRVPLEDIFTANFLNT